MTGEVEFLGKGVPKHAIIGLLGEDGAAISAALRAVRGVAAVDYALDACEPVELLRKRRELTAARHHGESVLLATWNETLLGEFCDEIWWIERGAVIAQGDPREILERWKKHAAERWRAEQAESAEMDPAFRAGDRRARVRLVELIDANGSAVRGWMSGEDAGIRVDVEFAATVEDPVIGILIRTRIGLNVYGTNTELEQLKLGPRRAGDSLRLTFRFRCDICPGEYTVTVASHDSDGTWHEWLEDVIAFTVGDTRYTAGVANLRARVEWAIG